MTNRCHLKPLRRGHVCHSSRKLAQAEESWGPDVKRGRNEVRSPRAVSALRPGIGVGVETPSNSHEPPAWQNQPLPPCWRSLAVASPEASPFTGGSPE